MGRSRGTHTIDVQRYCSIVERWTVRIMLNKVNKNSFAYIETSNHFKKSYQPFSVRLLGERLYIVSAPQDVAMVYKNSSTFSWDAYLDRLLDAFGLTADARKLSWTRPEHGQFDDTKMRVINPQSKTLVHLIEDFYKIQLLPGKQLDIFMGTVLTRLDQSLMWTSMQGPYVLRSTMETRKLSMKHLCAHLVTDTTTRAMFGDLIFEFEPDLINYMAVFNAWSWACVFGVPSIFTPALSKAKIVLSKAINKYVRTPKHLRHSEAWSITSIIDAAECFGMDEESTTAMLFMIWWA